MSPMLDWASLAETAKNTENSFDPAPAGKYTFTIDEAKADVSKAGNKVFRITTHIDSGPQANKKVWHDLTLNQDPAKTKSLRIFFENMAVFGMPYEWFNASTTDEQIVANLVNKRFEADITIDEYQGKKNNKITGYTIREASTLPDSANEGVPSFGSAPAVDPWQAPPVAAAPAVQQAPPAVQTTQAAPPAVPATPSTENPWGTPPPPAPAF